MARQPPIDLRVRPPARYASVVRVITTNRLSRVVMMRFIRCRRAAHTVNHAKHIKLRMGRGIGHRGFGCLSSVRARALASVSRAAQLAMAQKQMVVQMMMRMASIETD